MIYRRAENPCALPLFFGGAYLEGVGQGKAPGRMCGPPEVERRNEEEISENMLPLSKDAPLFVQLQVTMARSRSAVVWPDNAARIALPIK